MILSHPQWIPLALAEYGPFRKEQWSVSLKGSLQVTSFGEEQVILIDYSDTRYPLSRLRAIADQHNVNLLLGITDMEHNESIKDAKYEC